MLRNSLILAVALLATPAVSAADVEVTFDTFYAPLSDQGEWVVVGDYGRVWRPHGVAAGWRPYYEGKWVLTEDGYMWVSDEPWGWATYHYGRWSFEPGWGWIWVPGFEWAPAWVEWRYSEGAVGWAPLFPTTVVVANRPVAYDHWTFVPTRSFVGGHVRGVAYSPERVRTQWADTRSAPAYHRATAASGEVRPATYGPPRTYVEQHVGHTLEVVKPIAVSSPAQAKEHRGAAVVFRPGRSSSPQTEGRSAPAPVSAAAPERGEARRAAPQVETPPSPAAPAHGTATHAAPPPARAHEAAQPAPARVEPQPVAPANRVEPRPVAPANRVEPRPVAPANRVEPRPVAPANRVEPRPVAPANRVEPRPVAPANRVEPRAEPARPMQRPEPALRPSGGEPRPAAPPPASPVKRKGKESRSRGD